MSDLDFIERINTTLRKPGATIEASQYLSRDKIHRIIEIFSQIDPYVQGVLLQSVINLSSDGFESIEKEYLELLSLARDISDEWVHRKAKEFERFPVLTIDEEITELKFSGLFEDYPTALNISEDTEPEIRHFSWKDEVKPPSYELPPPRLPQKSGPKTAPLPLSTSTSIPRSRPSSTFPFPPSSSAITGKEKEKEKEKEIKQTKKKAVSLEELQSEQAEDYRPESTRKK
jgi:hypothetical protein